MSNVAGKAYAMNVLTPMKPPVTWINAFLFAVARVMPSTLRGLLNLSLIHFARWAIIKRERWNEISGGRETLQNDYMLFMSNFNGTWDQYVDAFSDGIPNGLDLFWYSSTKYPNSIPITPFKNYIRHNQIDTDYYYNATPGASQRDIKAALRVYAELLALEKLHATQSPGAFAESYRQSMQRIQNSLGSTGRGPVASNDAANAERNRLAFVAKGAAPAPAPAPAPVSPPAPPAPAPAA